MKKVLAAALVVLGLPVYAFTEEPSKASESAYNTDMGKANTSEGLTKADLAWHATHTYGWNCSEVVSKGAGQSHQVSDRILSKYAWSHPARFCFAAMPPWAEGS